MSSIGEANMEVISELNSSLARVKFGKVDVITSRESTTISEKDDHHGDDELQHQETTVVDSEPITGGVCLVCVHECLTLILYITTKSP